MAKSKRVGNKKSKAAKRKYGGKRSNKMMRRKGKTSMRRRVMKMLGMQKGGASWISGIDRRNLGKIWNSLFYERAKSILKFDLPELEAGKKVVLFVIDMQKDFVDRKYNRITGITPNYVINKPTQDNIVCPNPVVKNFRWPNQNGNFCVADGIKMLKKADGSTISSDEEQGIENIATDNPFLPGSMLDLIWNALFDPESKYSKVVFSRDYHPRGHNSFNNQAFNDPIMCMGCAPGGTFPAHCVQGFEGSKFIPEIELMLASANKAKYEVVFKGMHKNVDSFSAVGKARIDDIASNISGNCKCKNCGSITGGYKLKDTSVLPHAFNDLIGHNEEMYNSVQALYSGLNDMEKDSLEYNTALEAVNAEEKRLSASIQTAIAEKFMPQNYDFIDGTIDTIEVCGLAGDYCVRDTVVALSEKFPEKKVVVLSDHTRYAILPFASIQVLPQHNYSDSFVPFVSYGTRDEISQKVFSIEGNKAIIYYLLKSNEGGLELMELDDIPDFGVIEGQELYNAMFNLAADPPSIFHFITPHESIIKDFNKSNIYISMTDKVDKPAAVIVPPAAPV